MKCIKFKKTKKHLKRPVKKSSKCKHIEDCMPNTSYDYILMERLLKRSQQGFI